jgi:hypothetical protein
MCPDRADLASAPCLSIALVREDPRDPKKVVWIDVDHMNSVSSLMKNVRVCHGVRHSV